MGAGEPPPLFDLIVAIRSSARSAVKVQPNSDRKFLGLGSKVRSRNVSNLSLAQVP